MKTVRHIIAVMGYSIFLRLCYCLFVYGKVLLYGDWKEELFYHAANVVPMAVMAGCFIMLQVYKAAVPEWEVDYAESLSRGR